MAVRSARSGWQRRSINIVLRCKCGWQAGPLTDRFWVEAPRGPGPREAPPPRRASRGEFSVAKPVFEKRRALALARFEAIYQSRNHQRRIARQDIRRQMQWHGCQAPPARGPFQLRAAKGDTVTALKPPNALTALHYSVRSAFIGSVEAARRAGRMLAIAAQTPKAIMDVPSTNGS